MNSFDIYKQKTKPTVIKGFLTDTYIKKDETPLTSYNHDYSISTYNYNNDFFESREKESNEKQGFDIKSALKPLLIATGASVSGIIGITAAVSKYSKAMAQTNDLVRPGDLARSINIVEEPHLAMYRALRDPNFKNIAGLIGVGGFSLLILSAKNCVDGIKEIWIKKQNCDIEYDFKKDLIDVEARSFSGKLDTINSMLKEKEDYFKNVLHFRGKEKDKKDKKDTKNILPYILFAGLGFCTVSALLFKNYQKIAQNLDTFKTKMTDSEIRARIEKATLNTDKQQAIEELSGVLKFTNATEKTMESNFSKIPDITQEEIKNAIKEIKNAQIYAQAPEALGGISEKIQYYCYVNEERGHLYNWILNPENKFNKYLFLSFCFVSSIGYLTRNCFDAVKQVAITKQNSKNELELRKKLIEVEINNFKTKKMCAIHPLEQDFKNKLKEGRGKEELYLNAQNILSEIKNGPPYVYD